MKNSPLPLNRSVASDAARSCDFEGKPTADLRSLAIQSLEDNPIFRGRLALGAIQIESDGDTLVLNGCMPSYYLKQLLQETLRHVDGVAHIKNHVEIANPSGLLPTN